MTFVGLNAMIAREYMHNTRFPTKLSPSFPYFATRHGLDNPKAQFHKKITVEDVLKSPLVADPLTLFDCSGIGDGAAALILTSAENARKFTDSPVAIAASAVATDRISLYRRPDITTFEASRKAAATAYQRARINADDVDVLEVHDAFSVLGIMALEDLGFAAKGTGSRMVKDGECAKRRTGPN